VSLLSCPLPESVLLPARLNSLVTKLVEKMVGNPCTGTIRPVHRVLFGLLGRANLFDALSAGIMEKFQAECIRILRNLNDHIGNMLCLATFACVSSAWKQAMDSHDNGAPAWLLNIHQFFGPKHAQKTFDVVFLSVVMACSDSRTTWSTEDAVDCVQLASEICSSVESQQKEIWVRNNPAKIAKLCEKITRDGINLTLQMVVRVRMSII
jgi:hypothetical protein